MVVTGDFGRAISSGDREYTWLKREYVGEIGGYTAYKSIYLNGHCGVMALALHDMYGYEIYRIGDKSGYLHDFCWYYDLYIDVRGITSDISLVASPMLDIYSGDAVIKLVRNRDVYREEIERKIGQKEYRDSYEAAIKIIKKNRNLYSLKSMGIR